MSDEKLSVASFSSVDWSFLRSKEWFGYFALVIVFSIVSVFLGMWQMDRRDDVLVTNARIINNWDQAPTSLETIVPNEQDFEKDLTWRQVELSGQYLSEFQTLARTRPLNGKPGFEILVPFQSGNEIILVNRGWVPKGFSQDLPDVIPAAPQGTVDVTVRLRPSEPKLEHRSAPPGQVASIFPPDIYEQYDISGYTAVFGALVTEVPTADSGILTAKPELTEGPHLGYSLQWYVFAGLAYVALIYFIYTEARRNIRGTDVYEAQEVATISEPLRPMQQQKYYRKSVVKRGSDEEYEDGI